MKVPRYKWQPTTAEIAANAGIAPSQVERFDHNTSPMPTTWAAAVVAGSSSRLNEYPAASYFELREAVARTYGLSPDQVAPGAGADELILLAGRAFLSPGSRAVQVSPTYPLYAISSAQIGAELITIESHAPGFAIPEQALVQEAASADVVWLCAPNNPTGARPEDSVLRRIIEATSGVVVLDAAYAEFAGDDWAEWVVEYDNLLVLHTLSKAFGLAGARVGYGLGDPVLISALDGYRPPGSIGSLSTDLAVAALNTPARMKTTVLDLTAARQSLATSLADIGFRVLPSRTNFVLCEVGDRSADLHGKLIAEGMVTRDFADPGPLADYLRFTVRTPNAHRRLIDGIRRALA